jgi:hypothetical protein
MQKVVPLSNELIKSGEVSFGVKDKKGRDVGCKYTIRQKSYRLKQDDDGCHWHLDENIKDITEVYSVACFPQRDNKKFGSSWKDKSVQTLAEAEAVLEKMIEESRKRQVKQFG